jgi:hypothetical protein
VRGATAVPTRAMPRLGLDDAGRVHTAMINLHRSFVQMATRRAPA